VKIGVSEIQVSILTQQALISLLIKQGLIKEHDLEKMIYDTAKQFEDVRDHHVYEAVSIVKHLAQ
jgi:hypothetical protein